MIYVLMRRKRFLVNTDPQRRCYNGCHASYEYQWGEWESIGRCFSLEKIQDSLRFFQDLNAYAVEQRGKGALCEFKIKQEEV